MAALLNWIADLMGFDSKTFRFSPQVRFIGATAGLVFLAVVTIGIYVVFRKAFGGLEDFDGAAAGALGATAAAATFVLSAFIMAGRGD